MTRKLRAAFLAALVLSNFLSGCHFGPSEEDTKAAAEKAAATAAAARQTYFQAWAACLGPALHTALSHMPSRREAADFALLDCRFDEDNFRAAEGPSGQARFEREKARVTAAMIEGQPLDAE